MANETIIYGIHAVSAALAHRPEKVLTLYCQQGNDNPRLQPILKQAKTLNITVQAISAHKMEKWAEEGVHQGIAASVRATPAMDEKSLLATLNEADGPVLLLVLEGVQDPHNLGACLRSAEALGVKAVILPKDNSAPINATVSKAACGADQVLSIVQVSNLVRCLESLKEAGIWLVGTSGNVATPLDKITLPKRVAVIMGSEGKGLKRLTLETCDEVVKIPLMGTVSSLNVSVATGICLYEWQRQRQV